MTFAGGAIDLLALQKQANAQLKRMITSIRPRRGTIKKERIEEVDSASKSDSSSKERVAE